MENKRIDFNLIIGFLLIGLLLYLMNSSLTNSSEEIQNNTKNNKELIDKKSQDKNSKPELDEESGDGHLDKEENDKKELKSDFLAPFENTLDTLSNDNVQLIFSNHCGCFIESSLIEKDSDNTYKYEYYKGDPVKLINETEDSFPLKFNDFSQFKLNKDSITDNKLIYEDEKSGFKLTYTLDEANKLNLTINEMPENSFTINWNIKGPRQEKNLNTGWISERTQSYLYYAYSDGDYDYISEPSDPESEGDVSWVAYKQQFFSTILFSKNKMFWARDMTVTYEDSDTSYVKEMNTELVFKDNTDSISLDFYFLANDFSHLKSFDTGESASFDILVDIGWGIFGWVNQYLVIPVFDLLESLGLGYGLIILAIAKFLKVFFGENLFIKKP